MRKYIIISLCIVFMLESQAVTRYVCSVSYGSGDGSSWTHASGDLQEMINISSSGDVIWVAEGTYIPRYTAKDYNVATSTYPNTDGGRENAFVLKAGVQLLGGFARWDSFSQRNWNAKPTILSGDRGIPNNNADNCHHVVISTHAGALNALLDGFIITGGSCDLVYGTYISVNGVSVNSQEGGGIYNTSSLVLRNVIIRDNTTYNGGGIRNTSAGYVILDNVLISDNTAYNGGGGITSNGLIDMASVTISGNTVISSGGGIDIYGTAPCNVFNSIIWGNTSGGNPAGNLSAGSRTRTTFTACLVGGEPIGGGIILNGNPFFVDRTNGDYRLTSCSPAIDVGLNSFVGNLGVDLAGNPRVYNGTVDLGAYECQTIHTPPTMTAHTTDTNICYRDTTTISITFGGTSPYQFIYTKNNDTIYDTVKTPAMFFNWKVTPSDTTIYKFVAIEDANCIAELTDSIQIEVIKPKFSNNFLNDTLCSGDKTQPIVFAGFITSFEWRASGGVINGIPTGIQTVDFNGYTVVNTGSSPITTTITATPKYTENGRTCIGADTAFSITVNPAIELKNIPLDDTLCNGETTTGIVFDADVAFTCIVNGGVINGLPTGKQTGDFGEYVLENQSNKPLTVLVKITSDANAGCNVKDTSFSITVFPDLTITNLQNDTLCDSTTTKTIDFQGNATIYEWSVDGNVLGLPTGLQSGSFGKYIVKNKTENATKSTITVTPKYIEGTKECWGDFQEFDIIVSPATVIESVTVNSKAQVLCEGDEFQINAVARGENLVYQWYQNGNVLPGERNKDFIVSAVTGTHSGEYYVAVTGVCGTVQSQKVKINAGGGDMLVEKWHDVILVNNFNEEYIGYQWYRNGRIIDKATNQFYQEKGGLNGCYSVELRLAAGGRMRSCERCAYKTGKSGEITVFPNPTAGKIIIGFPISDSPICNIIEIYDIVGKLQHSESRKSDIGQSEIQIDISHLANGIYFLKVDGKIIKIVKQ